MKEKKTVIGIIALAIIIIIAGFVGMQLFGKSNKDDNKSGETKTETALTAVYNKMQIGNDNNGYTMSLRLIGGYKDKSYNEDVIINSYKNEKLKITEVSNTTGKAKERHLYMIQSLVYTEVKAGLYRKSEEKTNYTNPNIYLKTLENAQGLSAGASDGLDGVTYTKYTYSSKKETVKELLKYTALGDIVVNSDTSTTVWVDAKGYVYKIEYNLGPSVSENETLILTVYYYGINQAVDYKYEDTALN